MSIVYIISAPSGSGKSTLVGGLRQRDAKIMFSISYTTRAPRGAEKEGESYHYVDRASFRRMIDEGEFLEWAEVFGNYYGTHRSYLDRACEAGCDLLLDIDVQGARQLKERILGAVSIFILAPSRQTLEQRLRARSEDSEEVIKRRLREAAEEIRNYRNYDYVLVNRDVDESVTRLKAIVDAERIRRERMEREIEPILASFGASTQEVSR
jgi:guanylate kinase